MAFNRARVASFSSLRQSMPVQGTRTRLPVNTLGFGAASEHCNSRRLTPERPSRRSPCDQAAVPASGNRIATGTAPVPCGGTGGVLCPASHLPHQLPRRVRAGAQGGGRAAGAGGLERQRGARWDLHRAPMPSSLHRAGDPSRSLSRRDGMPGCWCSRLSMPALAGSACAWGRRCCRCRCQV